jgi:pimeloyl-ACP methyl ester carboxylesterase
MFNEACWVQKIQFTQFIITLMTCLAIQPVFAVDQPPGDYVVILHGIARSSSHMDNLALHLARQGYNVINPSYPSTSYKLEQLADIIYKELVKQLGETKLIHFVGYSMGALLVRIIIHKYRFPHLGRVVQLAPPNHGSEVADFFNQNWLYQTIYGPAGQQLITDQSDIQHLFGPINYQLGIIAGNSTIDPISSFIIPSDDDGKVSVQRTQLTGVQAHIVVPASHTFFPSHKIVQLQTAFFLKFGVFQE